MATFSDTEALLSLSDIKQVENYDGLNFPDEYKEHLLQHNGGRVKANIFGYIQNGRQNYSDVDWFLAIYDGDIDSLKEEIGMVKIDEKRMPSHMIPIAHDSGGNLVCISCGTEDVGNIYFWDHENEVDYSVFPYSDYSNLYLIAKSFTDFIDSLKDDIPEV